MLNHVGRLVGTGAYAGKLKEEFPRWAAAATRDYVLELDAPPACAPLLSIFAGRSPPTPAPASLCQAYRQVIGLFGWLIPGAVAGLTGATRPHQRRAVGDRCPAQGPRRELAGQRIV